MVKKDKMKTYIQLLAEDLYKRFGNDMSRVAVVFPNKRASLFLNEALAEAAAQNGTNSEDAPFGGTLWAPAYITISELFRQHSDFEVADQILLVCRLYDAFCKCTGYDGETLDHFYNWGLLLLSDFDDLDKNMAPADKVFENVSDLHDLDSADYLSDSQREALKQFFSTFHDNQHSEMRERFMRLWSKLHDIYITFRKDLRNDGIAYEGMLYRDVAENINQTFEYDKYCFVGFNMLQVVEQKLFMHLKNEGKALFYWDYDAYYLTPYNEAGHFIKEYMAKFPDALASMRHDNFSAKKGSSQKPTSNAQHQITYLSAPTENLQARYVHDWLLENDRWKAGAKTAIVMADEKILQAVIRSLPDVVDKVNITTGYPLAQSPVTSLLHQLIELQTAGLITGTDKYRLRYVNHILRHPYARLISPAAPLLYQKLNTEKQYYPSRAELQTVTPPEGEEVERMDDLKLLFRNLDEVTLNGYDTLSPNTRLCVWMQQVVRLIAQTSKEELSDLDRESLFRTYQVLQRLFSLSVDGTLNVDVTTFRRLLMQIINTTTVPYHGEPIEGIQIMGVLETRCLDFDNVLVLSCNEGNMPKGVNDSSFIPHSVRRAYGLTTVEHKVGIYSYYFHRLLQRTSDATLAYNTSTEGINTGEMSRFMLQLLVESNHRIRQVSLLAGQETGRKTKAPVVKDERIRERLDEIVSGKRRISPSSLARYLRCQLRYYYQDIVGLREEDSENAEEMDNIAFGIIFHAAAENAYKAVTDSNGWVHADVLRRSVNDEGFLTRMVDEAFASELFHIDTTKPHFRPEYSGLQLINRRVILRLLKDQLTYDLSLTPFRIIGLEKNVTAPLTLNVNDASVTIRIGGLIDRLDLVGNDNQGYRMRVVDYKTGSRAQEALNAVEEIFMPANIGKHTDYYLQTMLYSIIVRNSKTMNPNNLPVSPTLMFCQKARSKDYEPTLCIGGEKIMDIRSCEANYVAGLSEMVREIINPDIPFTPTSDTRRCDVCPFRGLCDI